MVDIVSNETTITISEVTQLGTISKIHIKAAKAKMAIVRCCVTVSTSPNIEFIVGHDVMIKLYLRNESICPITLEFHHFCGRLIGIVAEIVQLRISHSFCLVVIYIETYTAAFVAFLDRWDAIFAAEIFDD